MANVPVKTILEKDVIVGDISTLENYDEDFVAALATYLSFIDVTLLSADSGSRTRTVKIAWSKLHDNERQKLLSTLGEDKAAMLGLSMSVLRPHAMSPRHPDAAGTTGPMGGGLGAPREVVEDLIGQMMKAAGAAKAENPKGPTGKKTLEDA